MRRLRILLCLALVTSIVVPIQIARAPFARATASGTPRTIPALQQWTPGSGSYTFTPGAEVIVDDGSAGGLATSADQDLRGTAERFADELADLEHIPWVEVAGGGNFPVHPDDIVLSLTSPDQQLGAEGYSMTVGYGIAISAPTTTGVFYGTRSVLQLLHQGATIPAGTARDWPTHPMRGLMVDVARKAFSYQWVQDQIRDAAYLKMNYLHLHLSDNEGFRLQSTKHPEISSPNALTKAQVSSLIAFAAQYHVQIVPEIDMPGHMYWILSRGHTNLMLANQPAIDDYIDLSNPAAYTFMQDIIDEFLPWFPSKYWDVGADEYLKNISYSSYPKLGAFAETLYGTGVGKPKDVFYYFLNWVDGIVRAQGKTLRIWNDGVTSPTNSTVLSGKVFPNSDIEVDYWAGQGLTPQAWTNMGVPLVNASENETYYVLDQGDTGRKPNPQYMYESWNPTLYQPYAGQSATAWQTQSDPTKNEGAVLHVWCDYPTAETEQQVAVGIMDPMRVLAQEDWGSPKLVPAYTDFAPIINAIGRPPLYGYEPAAISDMPPYLPYGIDPLANTTDQNADSWFAAAPSTPSNYVGVDLGRIESLSRVSIVAQSTATYYGSYPSVVEYSSDATTWTPLPTSGWPYLQAALPAGTQARYVRLRVTNPSATYPLNVYEFTADAAPM